MTIAREEIARGVGIYSAKTTRERAELLAERAAMCERMNRNANQGGWLVEKVQCEALAKGLAVAAALEQLQGVTP